MTLARVSVCLATLTAALLPACMAEAAAKPEPPVTYDAVSDAKARPKPPLPRMGPAGSVVVDPTFGCPILRVTDKKTAGGDPVLTPAGAEQNPWNADTTLFCLLTHGQRIIPFRFDPKTMKAGRIKGLPLLPWISGVAPFSYHDPNVCYGKDMRRKMIVKYDFATNTFTDVLDVAKVTGLPVVGMHAFTISANDVIAVSTDGSMKVWRFAHHRSTVHRRGKGAAGAKYNFWDTPRGNVSQDGRFYMFTSNWGETVGKDKKGRFRQDVFIVKLARRAVEAAAEATPK